MEENNTDKSYENEQGRAKGSAVMYGLLALVVTLVVASGIFFGGRAVYRALNGDDSNDNTATTPTTQTDTSEQAKKADTANDNQNTSSASTKTNQSDTSTSSSTKTTPATGDEPVLPHTGDPGL